MTPGISFVPRDLGPYTAQKDKIPGSAGMGVGADRLGSSFTVCNGIIHGITFPEVQSQESSGKN